MNVIYFWKIKSGRHVARYQVLKFMPLPFEKIHCLYDNWILNMKKNLSKGISLIFLLLVLMVIAVYEHISVSVNF